MNVCGLTRLLVPAFLSGLAVATFTGDDRYGWIAAAAAFSIFAAVSKARGPAPACTIPTSETPPSPVRTCLSTGEPDGARPPEAPAAGPSH